jgi:conjugative transposon TraK protein
MFQQLKNIDTAFKHIKLFSYLLIAACVTITCYAVFKSYQSSTDFKNHIYILANGKALEAFASDREQNLPVEARDHIATFHRYFFELGPDDNGIKASVTKAFYLADGSAKVQYDNLKESSFYTNLITGNVSQHIDIDSIQLDMQQYPFYFKCYATETLTRPTAQLKKYLVTQGYLRNVPRTDNNSHGFLIERWEILKNDTTRNKP